MTRVSTASTEHSLHLEPDDDESSSWLKLASPQFALLAPVYAENARTRIKPSYPSEQHVGSH